MKTEKLADIADGGSWGRSIAVLRRASDEGIAGGFVEQRNQGMARPDAGLGDDELRLGNLSLTMKSKRREGGR